MKPTLIIPIAGSGRRFREAGFNTPKPLLKVGGKTLLEWSIDCMGHEQFDEIWLVEHTDNRMPQDEFFRLAKKYGESKFFSIVQMTPLSGAATTVLVAAGYLPPDAPVVVANCDQVWDAPFPMEFGQVESGFIVCFPRYVAFHAGPEKWSYAVYPNSPFFAIRTVEKPKASEITENYVPTVGIYGFNRAGDLHEAILKMVQADDRTNGEFYLAPVYNHLDKSRPIRIAMTATMWGLGTPEDLDTFGNAHRHLGFHRWREENS